MPVPEVNQVRRTAKSLALCVSRLERTCAAARPKARRQLRRALAHLVKAQTRTARTLESCYRVRKPLAQPQAAPQIEARDNAA